MFLYFLLIILGSSGFFFALFLPRPEGFYAFIVIAALTGFLVSTNIWDTKRSGGTLVCPTGVDCEVVIRSRYAKFLNISLEYWGMAYFVAIIVTYLFLIFTPQLFSPAGILLVMFGSLAAGLFSIYLLFVQAFILRHWCIWCILTAMLSLTIAVTSMVSADIAIAFIVRIDNILALIRFLGFTLGVGGVSSMGFLFFHFLRDAVIDEEELESIKAVSELVWVGLGMVLISQFTRFIAHTDVLLTSGIFTAQIVSLLAFALSGAVLMIIYTPLLTYIPFQAPPEGQKTSSFATLRQPTLVLGVIAFVSWYFAFVTNFISSASATTLLSIFLVLILVAVTFTILWSKWLGSQRQ